MGPKADEERIPGIDVALADGEAWSFGGLTMHVMDTPGHTRGHITLWLPEADALFPGAEPWPPGKPGAVHALQQGWWPKGTPGRWFGACISTCVAMRGVMPLCESRP